jgi:NarL family two-component system response regulator LiaR
VKVLIVDDHPSVRLGLRALLDQAEDVEIVGEAGDVEGAMGLAAKLGPDLVILDLRLRGETSGAEACRRIKSLPDPPRVLIHTAYNTADDVTAATLAGADGYVHKGAGQDAFLEVMRRVSSGERVWAVSVKAQTTKSRAREEAAKSANLTRKEREVFLLMLERYSNAEIARALYVSLPTVKTHVGNIMRKLGIKRRKELF